MPIINTLLVGESSGVNSFNGRTGIVTPQNGDYTANMVGAIGLDYILTDPLSYFKFGEDYYGVYGGLVGDGIFIPSALRQVSSTIYVNGFLAIASGTAGSSSSAGTIVNLSNGDTVGPASISVNNIFGDLSDVKVNQNRIFVPNTSTEGIAVITLNYDSLP